MSADDSTPNRLLRDLGSAPVPSAKSADVGARRERVIAAMDRTFVNAFAERSASRRATPILAAAAFLLVVGAGWIWAMWPRSAAQPGASAPTATVQGIQGAISVVRAGLVRAVGSAERASLMRSDRVRTGAASVARVTLRSGAMVRVEPKSDVGFDVEQHGSDAAHGEIADLGVGGVEVEVPRLTQGRSFSVRTPNATVVVHGTRFFVEVLRTSGVVTNVHVTEGRVSVHHAGKEIVLGPGARWSSAEGPTASVQPPEAGQNTESPGAPTAGPATAPPSASAERPRPATRIAQAAHEQPASAESRDESLATDERILSAPIGTEAEYDTAPPESAVVASTLAEQNRIFAAAMAARRQGDDVSTIRHLDELIIRFPDSPLAQDARVERFRAQKRLEAARSH